MQLLTENFLSKYPDMPENMNELGAFVFYRTYSRWLKDKNRKETWKEAVSRAVDYNVGISLKQFNQNNFEAPMDKIINEAETLFDNVFNLRQFLSGRTHWIGGADSKVADKFPLANFNCAFIDVVSWEDLCDLFYLLLVGTGVGLRATKENIAKLKPIRTDFTLKHSPYNPLPKEERLQHTAIENLENGYLKMFVGDSKEGWVEALKWFILFLTDEKFTSVKHIKISYNSIRERGAKLETFGGTASGYEPLMEMFNGIEKVIKGVYSRLENNHVRPIHILDIANLIGNNVVVGGVRRTAEMFLCDDDDWEVIEAKKGINERQDLNHRRMSNNSICFEKKPDREMFHKVFESIKKEGEPAFVNMEAARKRRPNARGLNPCGEVILDSYEVCNLTTVNIIGFLKPIEDTDEYSLDYQGLMQAQALSARAGIRMTCLDLELDKWDKTMKRDRLIGCSITGWRDAMSLLNYNEEQEKNLLVFLSDVAHSEAIRYSHILRIPTPLLDTTVKPEGTLSQVAGGVSSGIHDSKSPFYIRRIRINANDPLVWVVDELGWTKHPEVGTPMGETPRTYVIDFPIKSGAKKTIANFSAKVQLERYFTFQELYTSHNASNTIYVKDDEWEEVEQIIWDNWDNFIGITLFPFDGGTYELAPYEDITKEQYEEMKSKMKPFDPQILTEFERYEAEKDLAGLSGCENGACPIM